MKVQRVERKKDFYEEDRVKQQIEQEVIQRAQAEGKTGPQDVNDMFFNKGDFDVKSISKG